MENENDGDKQNEAAKRSKPPGGNIAALQAKLGLGLQPGMPPRGVPPPGGVPMFMLPMGRPPPRGGVPMFPLPQAPVGTLTPERSTGRQEEQGQDHVSSGFVHPQLDRPVLASGQRRPAPIRRRQFNATPNKTATTSSAARGDLDTQGDCPLNDPGQMSTTLMGTAEEATRMGIESAGSDVGGAPTDEQMEDEMPPDSDEDKEVLPKGHHNRISTGDLQTSFCGLRMCF